MFYLVHLKMNEAKLLLNAYYEALYEKLESNKKSLQVIIRQLLTDETKRQGFENFNDDKFAAYLDACLAFVDERLETYNPIGFQYTFDRIRAKEAIELELQLNFYDSRPEFESLMEAIYNKATSELSEERLHELTEELIKECGAYPDKSIITAYQSGPVLGKLPDYIVACAIEKIIR
jgi:translation elongation factor EF-G